MAALKAVANILKFGLIGALKCFSKVRGAHANGLVGFDVAYNNFTGSFCCNLGEILPQLRYSQCNFSLNIIRGERYFHLAQI